MTDDGIRPPFGAAPGPLETDHAVIRAFAEGGRAGHSRDFYAEGRVLLADGDQAVALLVEPGTVLVRVDLTEDLLERRGTVEAELRAAGLSFLDGDTLWGVPVALQLAGLRLSSWDLWGTDLDDAFAAVRRTAAGAEGTPSGVDG